MSPVASGLNPKLAEVYSSATSTLLTILFFKQERECRRTDKQALVSEEERCAQKHIKHFPVLDGFQMGMQKVMHFFVAGRASA